jgi:predicted nucleotide-binding protein
VNTKKVFVIHGRNDALLKSMYGFLDAIGLEPIEWNRAISMTGKSTPSVSEIVSTAFQEAQAIVVLLTGDDVAKLRNEFVQDNDEAYERELTPQARPNVLFEAGMAMSAGDNRTVLVQVGKIRKFSDIQGLHITYLNNTPQKRQELVTKLRNAGCDIKDISAENRWMTTGDFEDKLDLSETHKESKKKSAAPVADDPLTRD